MTKYRTDWMVEGLYGMMTHYLIGVSADGQLQGAAPERDHGLTNPNRVVDQFNLKRFLQDFDAGGADWLIFTIGQNTGFYCSPNSVLDSLAGPGHCSQRDLLLELARAVKERGKRFIAYLPCEVKGQAEDIHQAFAWNPADETEFQKRYLAFIREYALRLGNLLDGWWYDGTYWMVDASDHSQIDFPAWFAASRAGNPEAVVAFNDGSFCVGIDKPVTPLQDYLSGEVEVLINGKIRFGREEKSPLVLPSSRFVSNADRTPGGATTCQWHALVPIDCFWGHSRRGPMEPPYYSDADLITFVKSCRAVGGAVTLNVGIYQEGHLGTATIAQLKRLKSTLLHGK